MRVEGLGVWVYRVLFVKGLGGVALITGLSVFGDVQGLWSNAFWALA